MLRLLAALVVTAGLVAPALAYEVATVADAGVVAGVVKFTGPPPKLEPLAVNKNRDVCGDRKDSEALVLGPDLGVRGSVILVEGVARGKKPGAEIVLEITHPNYAHMARVPEPVRAALACDFD